jgi:hypothetical protein
MTTKPTSTFLKLVTSKGAVRVVATTVDDNDITHAVVAVKVSGTWMYQCSEHQLSKVQAMILGHEKAVVLRPEVLAFARDMELKLRANDFKSSWSECSKGYLSTRLTREVVELLAALGLGAPEIQRIVDEKILMLDEHDYQSDPRSETVDVANFAMMIHDNLTHERF